MCFDGDTDIRYYRLMKAWHANENFPFTFYDAHDINNALDTSQEESIKRKLRERFANSKMLVVLIGENTKNLRKFVRWEMEVAVSLGLPIICVNLNGKRTIDKELCPAIIRDELAIHIPFGQKIIQYAVEHWPTSHETHRKQGDTGGFWYKDSVYADLKVPA